MVRNPWSKLIQDQPWSKPVRLAEAEPPKAPGVYVVQAKKRGRLRAIPRAAGVDPDGVLVIGETMHLARRIRSLLKAMSLEVTQKSVSHRAGLDYSKGHGWDYGRSFPLTDLVVRWWPTNRHKVLEAGLLERYRWEFLDRPPLNASIGSAGKAQRDAHGWLVL
ncbi:MAG: hypothetical protein IPL61_25750 [Myxococcales bacterium]|nr:hypothetical protein [Myxococcales bacterium]